MGFSTSGATMILFLGVLVSASVIIPSVERGMEDVFDAEDERNERVLDRRNAEIAIQNATYNATAPTSLSVNVTNAGSVTLSVDKTDLLLNGTLETPSATTIDRVSGRSLWAPGETLQFVVDQPPGEPARVGIVTELGLRDVTTNVTVVT